MRPRESKQNKKFREKIKAQRLHGRYQHRRLWVGLPRRQRPSHCRERVRFVHLHHAQARAADILLRTGRALFARPCLACMGHHLTRDVRRPRDGDWPGALQDTQFNGFCLTSNEPAALAGPAPRGPARFAKA